MRLIRIVNQSTVASDADVATSVAAVQRQANEHLAPAWGVTARLLVATNTYAGGGEVIHILDNSDQADALGYHERDTLGVPTGFVFAKTAISAGMDWRVTLSHELLEQLVDPYLCLTSLAKWAGKNALLALEVCDPVEADVYQIDGVPVSNFVFPLWFSPDPRPSWAKLDYLGNVTSPQQLTKGGYVSYAYNLTNWRQSSARTDPDDLGSGRYSRQSRRAGRNSS
jgi:hypothetical protein